MAVPAWGQGGDVDVVDAVRHHYVRLWGKPSRVAEFATHDEHVEVHKWDKARTSQGVTVYASLGASAADMPGTDHGHRVEYLVGLQPGQDDIASELASLSLWARQKDVTVGHGHTVGGDWPLWRGTAMTKFLILKPESDLVPALELEDGVHVQFLQAVPIFDSERRFNHHHGVAALLKIWEDAHVPFWNPQRSAHPGEESVRVL